MKLLFAFIFIGIVPLWAMENAHGWSTESEFSQNYPTIMDYWEKGEEGSFSSDIKHEGNFIQIAYKIFLQKKEKGAVVISSGRTESMVKYQEVIYDLGQKGYSVYIFDHRGQGFSDRMLADKEKGYVRSFDDYISDLKKFVGIVKKKKQGKLFLLAHSMGGAIASRYLEMNPEHPFEKAILCSPMHGINVELGKDKTGEHRKFHFWQKEYEGLDLWQKVAGKSKPMEEYVSSPGAYEEEAYKEDNGYTHSQTRYNEFVRDLFVRYPKAILGGVTWQWLRESEIASEKAVNEANLIQIPVLILQGGEDKVVKNSAHHRFAQNMKEKCQVKEISGAYHELLIESDEYRILVLDSILQFMED